MITYGPISLDKTVQQKLISAIKVNTLEVLCEGSSKKTGARFDNVRATKDVVQFFDKHNKALVCILQISPQTTASPSFSDSLNCVLANPDHGRSELTQS